jgi:predicted DNA-binding transcriptional regulator YafY
MYQPTTRVLTVLELLQLHRRMTGAELAQRVEVTVRTLRRYITILQDLGIPIVAERGRYGAYELIPGFKLPPMMFTNDEALALTIGLLAIQHLGLTEIAHTIESTRAKLERVMPADLKERVQALTETIRLNLGTNPAGSSTETLITLSRAAKLQRRVHMHYRSYQDEETERDLDPYGLAHHRGKWYVVGHCSLRNDLRLFRLDRIFDVELTDISFHRPSHFDTLAYLVEKIATLPRQFTFEILLKTDLVKAQCEIMDILGIVESHEEGVLLRGSTDDLNWLARELAKLPFDFAVHEPEQLRDALRKRAVELANLAEAA